MSLDDALEVALAPLAVTAGSTREFTFAGVYINSEYPFVIVSKHAGFSNPALTSAQIKSFNERQARGSKLSVEKLEADRVADCKLFARHVVVGWKNANEEPGKPASPTPENVEKVLLAISKKRLDMFRSYTNWASDADNFTESPLGDAESLGK